jgi:hypothetical protein
MHFVFITNAFFSHEIILYSATVKMCQTAIKSNGTEQDPDHYAIFE